MAKSKKYKASKTQTGIVGSFNPAPRYCIAGLFIAVCATYLHTLSVPFYLDDFASIRDNFAIRDITDFGAIYDFAGQRFLGYFTFSLNYFVHEYSLPGYHLVNIAIHLLTSIVIYFLMRRVVEIPHCRDSLSAIAINWLPVFVAFVFLVHPLQTQAITYVVQRLASMAALFYLLGMLSYLKCRTATNGYKQIAWLLLVVIFTIAAVTTKQNAVTLPAALVLIEICFFGLSGKKLAAGVACAFLVIAMPIAYYYFFVNADFFASLTEATSETSLVTRGQYLAIQMGVVWSYIFKFIVPLSLQFEIDVPITDFSNPLVWVYGVGHLALICLAYLKVKQHPLLSFGLLLYYLALSVESSIIPIRDFAFEHRTYLPNFGLSLVLATGVLTILPSTLKITQLEIPVAAVLLVLAVLTWERNKAWRDPEIFFSHEIALSPNALRPYGMLGEHYLRTGEHEMAVETYLSGMNLIGRSFDRENNTQLAFVQNTVLALDQAERDSEALELLADLNWSSFSRRSHSKFLSLRGNLYAQQFKIEEAQADFEQALRLDTRNLDAKLSYGKVLYMQARMGESRQQFLEMLEIDPNHPLIDEAISLLAAITDYESQNR